MSESNYGIPPCEKCGCLGNASCGKDEPPWGGCELNESLECPCCATLKREQGAVDLPITPTRELLELIAVQRWPEDWEEGIKLQRDLGLNVVPPNAEMEMAAGIYKKLIDYLQTPPTQSE